jgi:4-amino-4-deoxy-L-arabinose transferase-like glycosyltransferase
MRHLKRNIVLALAIGAVAALATVALAESPHFIGTPTASKSLTSGLTVSGKAAGLGNGPTAAFLTASSVSATYECVNHGGNVAPGQPVVLQNVTGPTQNITPHNGQITFSPNIPPPPTPSARDACPNGNWTVRITSLTYNDVVLHIQQPPGTDVLTLNLGTIDP